MRAYRGIFLRKKEVFKTKLFLFICFEVWANFFCLLTKKSSCQRNNLLLQKKMEENVCTKIVFYSNQFRISSRIVRTLRQKTHRIVKTTFKKFSGTILGRFFGLKKFCSRFLVVQRNFWTFGVSFFVNFLETAA